MGANEHFAPVALVVVAVLVANGIYLVGLANPNPLNLDSGLGVVTRGGWISGVPYLDPNSGVTAQALGHLAALDWLHGHVPWWNPFEGLGAPLAGEMQSAALFPLVLLLALSTGQLFFHIVLEVTAGLSSYFLLRRLVASRLPAVVGGVAFALNGTFAWFAHAPVNPVAFLPMCLLGVERARESAMTGVARRWILLALAMALSAYAGFPESAYIDGLFVLVWAVVRMVGFPRAALRKYVSSLGAGLGVGALLAAPILVAFADYLPSADIGTHGTGFANAVFSSQFAPSMVTPYLYGPLFGFSGYDHSGTLARIWGNVGGYVTASLIVLAAIGIVGRRRRPLRLALGAWVLLALGRTFGFPLLQGIVNFLPEMTKVAFFRYAPASWELAVIVLAVLAIDDLSRGSVSYRAAVGGLVVGVVAIGAAALEGRGLVGSLAGAPAHWGWYAASVSWSVVTVTAIAVGLFAVSGRARGTLIACVVALDVLAMFVTPELSAPRSASVDTGVVRYLQHHLGTYRFFTLGPLQPDYGSYWQIASVDVNDLPVPNLYSSYITSSLDTNVDPLTFTGATQLDPKGPDSAQELVSHLGAYEKVGVKYVIVPSGFQLPIARARAWPVVYSDRVATVLELAHPAPLFHSETQACVTRPIDYDSAAVWCLRPAMLEREELYMAGWSATVNGRAQAVERTGGIFQGIKVPARASVVRFSFAPPYIDVGLWAFVLGALLLVLGPLVAPALRRARELRARVSRGTSE